MSIDSIDSVVTPHPELFIRQRKEWTEIIVDWETSNRYEILGPGQQTLGMIAERGGGLLQSLKRAFLRAHRGFEIDVFNPAGVLLLTLARSFFFFFSDLAVTTPDGTALGSVHRRFGILFKKYDLRDASGRTFARIRSPLWRLWTFPILAEDGSAAGSISKKWGGALREVFSDADTFRVDFASHAWSSAQRAVIFAAAISVDFDFFENNQGSGGLIGD